MSASFLGLNNGLPVRAPVSFAPQSSPPTSPVDGQVYYDTALGLGIWIQSLTEWVYISGGSGIGNPITLTQILTPTTPVSGSDSIYFKNDNNLYILNSAGVETPIMQSGSAAFVSYVSNPIVGQSTGVTSTTWTTASNSPSFTITPSVSGTYKVYCPANIQIGNVEDYYAVRIFNTSANASLIAENQGVYLSPAATNDSSGFPVVCQSTYTLIAGTTYVFDIQLQSQSASLITLGIGYLAQQYMFCEGIALNGTLNTGGSSFALYTSNAVTTNSTPTSSPTFVTTSNSPAFTLTPVVSGTYKVYSTIPLLIDVGGGALGVARIWNTSTNATLLSESQALTYLQAGTDAGGSVTIQSVYQLTAGTAYIFDIQVYSDAGAAPVEVDGGITPFYMYAEGVGLASGAAQQFPVKMKYGGAYTAAAGNPIILTTLGYDSNSAYNPTTGVFTVPYAGDYVIGFSGQSSTGGIIAYPLVNGNFPNGIVTYFSDTSAQNGDINAGEVHAANLKVGDQVQWQSGSSTAFNGNTALWIYSVSLAGSGLYGPSGASNGSSFAYYASASITTQSSGITSTWATFDNSPGLTFTPTISGIYKVYCPLSLYINGTNVESNSRIFNTVGGATLLQESQGEAFGASGGIIDTAFCQSTYSLTAGVTYTFVTQGQTNGGTVYSRGGTASFNIFAEGIGLVGQTSNAVTAWATNDLALTASASFGGTINQTVQTRVVGNNLEVKFYCIPSSPNSDPMSITLPTGYAIDSSKLSSTGSFLNGMATAIQSSTDLKIDVEEYMTYPFFNGSDVNNIYFAADSNSGGPVAAPANSYLPSGLPWTAEFSVPIVGLFGGQVDAVSTIAKSNSTGTVGYNSTSQGSVLDSGGVNPITVTVTTNGGDVEIGFQDDGSGSSSSLQLDQTPSVSGISFFLYRDGNLISNQFINLQNNVSIEIQSVAPSAFKFIDSPPAGSHTYTVQAQLQQTPRSSGNGPFNCVLYAKPTGTAVVTGVNGPTSWTAYTPTIVGVDTVSGVTCWYKYDGADSILIKGTFTTGATPSSDIATITLPSGYTINGSKVNGIIELVGDMAENASNSVAFYVLAQPNVSVLNFGYNTFSSGGLATTLGNQVFTASTTYSFITGPIPIS